MSKSKRKLKRSQSKQKKLSAGEVLSLRPKSQRAARRLADKAANIAIRDELIPFYVATEKNGAGLVVDKQLRYFFREYNTRICEHGTDSLPLSFNAIRDYFEELTRPFIVQKLRPEKDHVFSFSDFVDFVTSDDVSDDPFKIVYELQENVIYSYNCCDDPHDLMFSTDGGKEWGVSGVAMLRKGSIVTVMLICGKTFSPDEQPFSIEDVNPATDREMIKPAYGSKTEIVPLSDTSSDLWKTVVVVRFDIKYRTIINRYVLYDHGNYFAITTDDIDTYGEWPNDRSPQKFIDEQLERLEEHNILFEICKSSLLLPQYFAFKITLIRDEVNPTKIATAKDRTGPNQNELPPGNDDCKLIPDRIKFRRVAALRIVSTGVTHPARRYSPPAFRVEVRGFLRKLESGSIGKDEKGNPIQGQTWIHPHSRWTELATRPIEVLVKSRISIARRIAEAELLAKKAKVTQPETIAGEKLMGDVRANRKQTSREEMYQQRKLLTHRLRWKILERDDFRCRKCGIDAATDHSVKLEVDHIVPIAEGGKTVPSNLQTLCTRCNRGKADEMPTIQSGKER